MFKSTTLALYFGYPAQSRGEGLPLCLAGTSLWNLVCLLTELVSFFVLQKMKPKSKFLVSVIFSNLISNYQITLRRGNPVLLAVETMTEYQSQYHILQSGKHLSIFLSNVVFQKPLSSLHLKAVLSLPDRDYCIALLFYFSKGNGREDLMRASWFQFHSYQLPSLSPVNVNLNWKITWQSDSHFLWKRKTFQNAMDCILSSRKAPEITLFFAKFRNLQWYYV